MVLALISILEEGLFWLHGFNVMNNKYRTMKLKAEAHKIWGQCDFLPASIRIFSDHDWVAKGIN